jgi:hypothetical protein
MRRFIKPGKGLAFSRIISILEAGLVDLAEELSHNEARRRSRIQPSSE